MIVPTQHHFAHRANRDGSFDSICVGCYQTVAQRSIEADLLPPEALHRCHPTDLLRLNKLRLGDVQLGQLMRFLHPVPAILLQPSPKPPASVPPATAA